ncbi:uncharacterized protein [Temnothorax nylanderi]|uniref:uncharacterized protein n=1 Tax=Temnothorax nylanderi TaxID=102681 RepID=UPI003A8B6F5B
MEKGNKYWLEEEETLCVFCRQELGRNRKEIIDKICNDELDRIKGNVLKQLWKEKEGEVTVHNDEKIEFFCLIFILKLLRIRGRKDIFISKVFWCKWRVAEATGQLADFHHEPALQESVQKAIRPVYEALSSDDLLQRCTGGNTQNDNESFNACIWKLAPKHLHCGVQTIRIAAYIAAGIFNEGYSSILKTMNTLGIIIGPNSKNFAVKTDEKRIAAADKNMSEFAKKARIEKINMQVQQNNIFEEEEGTLYGAGIAD